MISEVISETHPISKNLEGLYDAIRDTPYRIPLTLSEEDNCCSGKVARLKALLTLYGYKSRYQVCTFLWSELNLPERVISIPHEDKSTHVFLEVFIDDKWIQVDPTWDSALRNIFSISKWNKRDTPIAVKPIELLSLEESRKIMEESVPEDRIMDLAINGAFYSTFNEWLEEERLGN